MFHFIDHLVSVQLFALQVWDNANGSGVWAALGTEDEEVDYFRNLSVSSDDFSDVGIGLVLSTKWLPYVLGETMLDAMQKLEARLVGLPSDELIRESDWADLIICAISDLRKEHKVASAGDKQEVSVVLGRPFDEALQVLNDRYGPWPRWKSMRNM